MADVNYVLLSKKEYDKLISSQAKLKIPWEVTNDTTVYYTGDIKLSDSLYRQIRNIIRLACGIYSEVDNQSAYNEACEKFSKLSLWKRIFYKPEYL